MQTGSVLGDRQYDEIFAPHVTSDMRMRFREAVFAMPHRRRVITPDYAASVLDALSRIASVWGGTRISTEFDDFKQSLRFTCVRDHEFELRAQDVRQGKWCPTCAHERYLRVYLAEMRELAAQRGGLCLSDVDRGLTRGLSKPLLWQCAHRHQWLASSKSAQKSWCRECEDLKKALTVHSKAIGQMQELAASHGGLCLSDVSGGLSVPLRWQCAHGHQWAARFNSAQKNWCRECKNANRAPKVRSRTIADMQELAATHGGLCLSTEYSGMYGRLDWQCQAGHRWNATAYSVSRSRWCPACGLRAGWQRELEQQSDALNAAGAESRSCLQPPLALKLRPDIRPEVVGWLEGFRTRRLTAHPGGGKFPTTDPIHALAYVLIFNDPRNPEVHLYKASLSVDGAIEDCGKRWRGEDGALTTMPRFVTDEDLAILRSLGRSSEDTGSFALRLGTHAVVLETLINTGRAFAEPARRARPMALRAGAVRRGEIEWQAQADERLRAVLRTEPVATTVLWTEPPWYVDMESGEAGTVDIPWRVQELADYLSMPSLSRTEASLVGAVLQEIAPHLPLPSEHDASAIRVIDTEPVAVLSFDTVPIYTHAWGPDGMQTHELDFATVSFDYNGVVLNANDGVTLHRNAHGEVVQIKRDIEFEKLRLSEISKRGLTKIPANGMTSPLTLPSNIRGLSDPRGWPGYIQQTLPSLREKGWRVVMSRRFRFSVVDADAIVGTLQQTSDGWFDVELVMTLGPRSMNLAPLLPKLFRRDRRWLSGAVNTIADDEMVEFKTNLGERLRLRAAWLKPIVRVLQRSFDPDKAGFMKVAQNDVGRLEALIKTGRWQFRGDASICELARCLQTSPDTAVP